MQVRYIDKNGNEQIRVDRPVISSNVTVVSKDKLQNKKNRYYFKESINKRYEEVWFSAIDLNIENGKVETPFNPTFRAILPIQKDTNFNGIIIINYFMDDFLNSLKENTIYSTILFKKNGDTLSHFDSKKSWGNYLKNKYNLNFDYKKEITEAIKNEQFSNNEVFIKKLDVNLPEELYLLVKLKDSYLAEIKKQRLNEYTIIIAFILIFSTISAIVLSKIFNTMSKDIKKAKIEADNANKAKSKFLANMSHEIRTPLNGIIGLNKLALQSNPNEKIKEFLEKSEISSNALLNVINDILDYSKIEANKLSLEKTEFEFDRLLLNVTNLFDYQANQKGVDLHIDFDNNIPKKLIGDPLRITQIFNNLVGNAVKFTNSGNIKIKAQLHEKQGNNIVLKCSIKDTGIGMTKDEQKKLFSSFSQVDNSNTRIYGGTGLGLSICKDLISLMNGEINVRSEKNLGTIFEFSLKLDFENENTIENNSFVNKKFLVVDDNAIDIEILTKILNSWSINTFSCLGAKEAIEKLEDGVHFDFILVDWIMPDIDGVDFIKKVEKLQTKNCPNIVMVTAYEEDRLKEKLQKEKLKVTNILRKPFTPSSVYDTLVSFENSTQEAKSSKIEDEFNLDAKVLLVEDNEINQAICKEMLSRVKADVSVAWDGIEAVNMVQNNQYDIILMDLHMPNMDGYEATKEIRKFNKKTPIIALTAAIMSEDKKLSKEVGMQEHLGKPIDFDELLTVVSKYTNNEIKKKVNQKQINSFLDINFDELLKRTQSEEFSNTLLKKFVEDYKDYDEVLLDSFDTELFASSLHKLKGVSGNLAFNKLFKLCQDIEKEKEKEKQKQLLDKIVISLKNIIEKIEK